MSSGDPWQGFAAAFGAAVSRWLAGLGPWLNRADAGIGRVRDWIRRRQAGLDPLWAALGRLWSRLDPWRTRLGRLLRPVGSVLAPVARRLEPPWRALRRLIGGAIGRLPRDWLVLIALAALAASLDLYQLTISGYANTYYSAAAQAGSQSWVAMFYGSLDGSSFISLDKPPLATWLMSLSVRLLGLGSWSILLPEALLGVGTVVVLFLAVRRSFGLPAATIAGLVMALTPVAVLMFRFDQPEALLTFLLVASAWALLRAIDEGRLSWALLAAFLIGLGFMTKFLEAYLVVPGFAAAWLVSGPGNLRRRLNGLAACAGVLILASAWWVGVVQLIPASARPWIGGTSSNSVLDLVLGFDGFGRFLSRGAAGAAFAGPPGPLRLFDTQFAGGIAWFLPAALIALGAALVTPRRAPRRDPRLAASIAWGGWLIVAGFAFSFAGGVVHSYYGVVLAPAIAALVGALAWELWADRDRRGARLTLAATGIVTLALALVILGESPRSVPWLGPAVLLVGGVTALRFVAVGAERRPLAVGMAVVLLAATLAGPASYAAATIGQGHSGGDAAAGPDGDGTPGVQGGAVATPALVTFLLENHRAERWIVAVRNAPDAAAIQLATGLPVMTIGGFTGDDPVPTQARLQAEVSSGALRYVLVATGPGTKATFWAATTCPPAGVTTPTGFTLYDCQGISD